MGNETSVCQNNIKVKICNYSWSKSLELIKRQPKKFSFFRNYDLVGISNFQWALGPTVTSAHVIY